VKFSIVIPTWNDGRQVGATLKRLRGTSDKEKTEIIVVDGGSKDDTIKSARQYADTVIPLGGANRGAQFNKGAGAATGEMLLFLHADAQLPGNWQSVLEEFWSSESGANAAAAVFSVHYGGGFFYALAALGANLRVSMSQVAYGESSLCTRRDTYDKAGGFPDYPMMDDVALCKRLKKQGSVVRLKEKIRPAAHHLRRVGPIRNAIRSFIVRLRFALGENPESLFRRYYGGERKATIAPERWDGEALLKARIRGERPR